MSALILKQGRVIDPLSAVDHVLDVRISSGSVLELAPSLQARSERVLDVTGMWVVPGLVDLRCVLRDDADVDSALMGGLTAVMLTPESPRTGSVRLFVAHARALTRDLKGEELGEVADAAKVLSNGFVPLQKAGVLRRALQYASPLKKLVMVHPDDPTIS